MNANFLSINFAFQQKFIAYVEWLKSATPQSLEDCLQNT